MSRRSAPAIAALFVFSAATFVLAAAPASRMATYENSTGETFFALSLASTVANTVQAQPRSTDLVVLFDSSASQTGAFRRESLDALHALLQSLRPEDRVRIMAVDLNAVDMSTEFAAADAAPTAEAMRKLEQRVPLGTTDLSRALETADRLFAAESKAAQRAIVYIGDGMSRAGRNGVAEFTTRIESLVRSRIAVSSLAIGPSRDISTLASIANHTGGQILAPSEEFSPQQAGVAMANAVASPVIWPKSVTFSADIGDVFPKAMPPLRMDRDTILVGTLKGTGKHLVDFVGELHGQPVEMTWEAESEPSNEDFNFLPTVIDQVRPSGGMVFPAVGSAGLREIARVLQQSNDALVKLGSQALSRGDLQGAQQTAEAVLKRDPNNLEAQAIISAARKNRGTATPTPSPAPKGGDAPLKLIAANAQPADGDLLRNFEQNEGRLLASEEENRRRITQRTQKQVDVMLAEARRKMGSDPDSANRDLKLMLEGIEKIVELDADVRTQLRTMVESAIRESGRRAAVEAERRAGQEALRAEATQALRIAESTVREQEKFKQLMDRFNALMDEKRYRDAEEQIANQLRESHPDNPTAQAAIWSARSVFHINEQERLFDLRHRNFALALHEVEEAHIPFPAEPPIVYPPLEKWEQITRDRAKYKSVDLAKTGGAEARILKALDEPIDLEFTETSLSDVMDYIESTMTARQNPIQIELDKQAIEAAGASSDTPVTLSLKGVSLRSGLRLILKQHSLTYIVKDEVLMITSNDVAEQNLLTKVYPVADLVIRIPSGRGGGGMGGGGMGGGGMGGGGMGGGGMGGGGMGGGGMGGGGGMLGGGGGGGVFAVKDEALSLGTKKTPAATAEEPRVRKPLSARERPARIELPTVKGQSVDQAWTDYFAGSDEVNEASVRETARAMMEKKQYSDLIAMIQGALRGGKPQPWMYEALAIAMQAANAPTEDLERVLMSAVDFAGSSEEALFIGAYLARAGLPQRALSVFQTVAAADPFRPEPYMHGLKAAQSVADVEGIKWACVGLLNQQWPKEHREVGENARRVALATIRDLREQSRSDEADRFEAECKAAMQRDVIVKAVWTGDADIDLVVVEPTGSICSLHNPRTIGGGVISGDTTSGDGKSTVSGFYEAYVCPHAFSGEYKVLVKKVWGKVTTGHVTIEVVTHAGTPDESYARQNIPISDKNAVVNFELKDGRRLEGIEEHQIANIARTQIQVSRAVLSQALSANPRDGVSAGKAGYEGARDSFGEWSMAWKRGSNVGRFDVNRPGVVGFSPIVQQFQVGTQLSAQAIVSADRRYVRFTIFPVPISSDITEVSTFNFVSGASQQQQGGGQGGGGLGGGGGGGGFQ